MMMKASLSLSLSALLLSACATSTHIPPSQDLEQRVNEFFRDCIEDTNECFDESFEIMRYVEREFENYDYSGDEFNYLDFIWVLAPKSISKYDDQHAVYMTEYSARRHCPIIDRIFKFYEGIPNFGQERVPIIYSVDGVERDFEQHLVSCVLTYAGAV